MKIAFVIFNGLEGEYFIIRGINALLIIADNNLETEKRLYQFEIKTN